MGKLTRAFSNAYDLGYSVTRAARKFRISSYRYCYALMDYRCRREMSKHHISRSEYQTLSKAKLGDFSAFREISDGIEPSILINKADQIIRGEYDILGSGITKLKPINWHLDFKSGKLWEKGKFYRDYVQVDVLDTSDVKVPRELSRCHHLLALGEAFLITNEKKYSQEIVDQIIWWIDDNPFMHSINWGCAMDVAIRAVNWIYAVNMIVDDDVVDDSFMAKYLISLYQHGFYIFGNLEKGYRNSSNHYLSNLVGLVFIGGLLSGLKRAADWLEFAQRELFSEIRNQTLPSGVTYEYSVSYHRLDTELLFLAYMFLKRNGHYIPLDIKYRIKSLFDFILHYIKPSGLAPSIGDQDDGRLLPFGYENVQDHRYLMQMAGYEFEDAAYLLFPEHGRIYLYFINGIKLACCPAATSKVISLASKSFSDAGFCILRSAKTYVFISNNGATTYPDQDHIWGSHAHADMLSFELEYDGEGIITDPGTYTYSADSLARNKYRNSSMHNVLIVDGIEQQEYATGEIFSCRRVSRPTQFKHYFSQVVDTVIGEHDAYLRLVDPVNHTREFALCKTTDELTVKDRINCNEAHRYEWLFHLDRDVSVCNDNGEVLLWKHNVNMTLKISMGIKHDILVEDCDISKAYGTREQSTRIRVIAEHLGSFDAEFVFRLR